MADSTVPASSRRRRSPFFWTATFILVFAVFAFILLNSSLPAGEPTSATPTYPVVVPLYPVTPEPPYMWEYKEPDWYASLTQFLTYALVGVGLSSGVVMALALAYSYFAFVRPRHRLLKELETLQARHQAQAHTLAKLRKRAADHWER